jgi:hypothetical protein
LLACTNRGLLPSRADSARSAVSSPSHPGFGTFSRSFNASTGSCLKTAWPSVVVSEWKTMKTLYFDWDAVNSSARQALSPETYERKGGDVSDALRSRFRKIRWLGGRSSATRLGAGLLTSSKK